ncbi:cytoplasmic dynein 2 light intermediate chain 1 isoform X2 [Homalodisca vitripennis]|uniref:cytoplasmic dynein 2 light intermediate chain 1 isoform X2 n=1 Tax=Homalodisca vitripennis TaxID=197043 RepID=UPI001EEC9826|nr:cytoplasmic dynein 2 light intermediate chain 1 isoform X2 [Homalodisca vitripennis]
MSLRDTATNLARELLQKTTKTPHQKTILFVGSRSVGKTTLINRFLDRNDPAKKTLTLDYTFARKTSSHSLTKDICHIWELGGGALFTSVLVNGNSFTSYGPLSVVLMLDLSELGQLWNCMESLLDSIKRSLSLANQQIDELAQRICDDHPDRPFMDPFPTPLVIIGGKYDIFQEYEPEKRKIVCRCLRYISHVLCATLLFYSSKDAALVKRVKDVLNHHAFDAPLLKTTCQDYNKAVCVPCGSDLFESIEGVRTVTKHSLDKMRNFYTTHFPQDESKASSTILEDPNPVNDPNFREPLIDALRRQKDEELERYCLEMERREKRSL